MAVHQIQAPDGSIHQIEAPDDATPDQVMSFFQQSQTPTGFSTRVAQGWQKDLNDFNNIGQNGETYAEQNLQGAGMIGKALARPIGEAINSGVQALNNNTAPDAPYKVIGKGIDKAYQGSDLQDAVQGVKQLYDKGAQDNPRLAADADAFLNMGNSLAMVKGGLDAASGTASTIGSGLKGAGQDMIDARKAKFAQDLVTPKLTPTVKNEIFANSREQGLLNKAIEEPDYEKQNAIDAVSSLPIAKGNSLLKNYNIISDANTAEGDALKAHLTANDVAIPADTIENTLIKVRDNLADKSKYPYIRGDGEKAANDVIDSALQHVVNNPQTASGVLQARKDFDKFVKPSQFGAETYQPVNTAIQQVRQALNGIVADAVPSAEVKTSLAKQSGLITAMDNIESKGGSQATNRVSRTIDKVTNGIPGKGLAMKTAVAAGLGGASYVAPAIAAPLVGAYAGSKVLPYALKAAGFTLDNAGNLLKAGAPLTARDIGMLSPVVAMQVLKLNQGNQQ